MFEFEQLKEVSENHESRHWSSEFLARHHLQGFAYHKTKDQTFYPEWKSQLTRNLMVRTELEKIGRDFARENLDVCLLKGYSLMGDIYEDWGVRFASDVDLLVSLPNLWRLSDILNLHGYGRVAEKKWLGNRFKFMFKKEAHGIEINIEVHTQLFWHTRMDWRDDLRSGAIPGFKRLSLEKQLLHLCGHLAFQHTFLKLFWLVDVFYFIKSYHDQIHWQRFWNLATVNYLYKSAYLTFLLCKRLGAPMTDVFAAAPVRHTTSMWMLGRMVDFQYLHNPRKYLVRYFLVKNLIKDSVFQNFVYWFYWLKQKARRQK